MKLVVSCKEGFGGSRMARRRSQYISTACIGDAVNSVDGIPNLKPNLIIINATYETTKGIVGAT